MKTFPRFLYCIVLLALLAGMLPASSQASSSSQDHIQAEPTKQSMWVSISSQPNGKPMAAKYLGQLVRSMRASGYRPEFPAELHPDGRWYLWFEYVGVYSVSLLNTPLLLVLLTARGFKIDGNGCPVDYRGRRIPGWNVCYDVIA